jgi:hypothetical protein
MNDLFLGVGSARAHSRNEGLNSRKLVIQIRMWLMGILSWRINVLSCEFFQ